jgi:mitogen-activated protein kinase 1/3
LYDLALFEPKAELYMMMEKMDCDLHRVIQSKQPLSERHYKCFMKQLLEGIKAMHSVGCFHRDLKPGNILVSKDCQLRITDFGLARFMDESTRAGENEAGEQTTYVVTRWYRCPELLLAPNLPYTEAVDLWSCGCILAELINRKPLLPGKDHLHQIQMIFNLLGYKDIDELGFTIDRDTERILNRLRNSSREHRLKESVSTSSAATILFIEQLLQVNPSLRPSAEEALQSPFMDDVEVLHDYSRTYLRRPAPDFFEFETKRFSVAELKKMVLDEVANSKIEPATQANSPDSMRRSSGRDKPSAVDSSSADKYRAHQRDDDKGFISVPCNQSGSNMLGDDRSGPPSQLATVRAHPGHAAVEGNAVRRESKVHKDNPFKSSGSSSSQSNNSANTEKLSHRDDDCAPSVTSAGSNGSTGDLPRSQPTNSQSAKGTA